MGRPRRPERDKAKLLWLESKKKRQLKDIAIELGVSETQVRKWKHEDKWEKCTLRKIGNELVVCVPKSCGAPKGSANALGHGAPKGNKNAVTTGEFESIFFDTLEDDERTMINDMPTHRKELLRKEIQLLTARERRMMTRINKFKASEGQAAEITTTIDNGAYVQKVKANSKLAIVLNIEEALTRIQAQKRQCIDLLDKIERGEMEMW